uniref:Uncharacterized protein LOC107367047 isoform X4 n=1 Tax=Tetranychus evansi TaxID=178897 RepID=A0A3G5AP94_9ACAR|nr:uncharacterized protein LOC107367047 isoform X4 [Tetranychus evansi]
MKFSIVVIAFVLTASSVSSDDSQKYFDFFVKAAPSYVTFWAKGLPGWNAKSSLKSNVLSFVNGPNGPGWNSDLSKDQNVENIIKAFNVVDDKKTLAENIRNFINYFVDEMGFSSLFPKGEMEQTVFNKLVSDLKINESELNKPVIAAIQQWINSFGDLKDLTGNDFITGVLGKAINVLGAPTVSPSNTLDDIITGFINAWARRS